MSREDLNDTGLHICVRQNHEDVVKTLINHGIDVNIRGQKDRTALSLAVQNRTYSIVKLLLEHDAEVESSLMQEWEITEETENSYKILNLLRIKE